MKEDDEKTLLTIATLAVGALTLFGAYKQLSDRVNKKEQKTGPDAERKFVKPSEPKFPYPVPDRVFAPLVVMKDFEEKNRELIFETKAHKTEFMARINNSFTKFYPKESFTSKWAYDGFPAGRYVIVVYQRHSVYQDGQCIYVNRNFENIIGDYSRFHKPVFNVCAEEDTAYRVSTWGEHKLKSCVIMDPKLDNLNALEFETAAEAAETAKKYSLRGCKTAVIEWYADYDMY